MNLRLMVGLIVHLTVCAVYIPLHNFGVGVYISWYGGLTSRGVGIGMTNELMFYFFAFMNVVVFLVSKLRLKLSLVLVMAVIVLYYFLPGYPVRAMAYAFLGGLLMTVAICVRLFMENLVVKVKSRIG